MSRERSWQQQLETDTRTLDGLSLRTLVDLRVPGLTILSHPDPDRAGERVALPELVSDRELLLSRLEPRFASPSEGTRRPLADPHLSRQPIRLTPGLGGTVRLDRSATTTEVMADGEPIAKVREFSAAEIEAGVILLLGHVVLLLHRLEPRPRKVPRFGLVGDSTAMGNVRQEIRQASELTVPVLLRGETGTGKELIARALHESGSRRHKPYVAVNMGAIPATLAASELFGAAKGAFTGAERSITGYFGRADGGTLFLDEIGEAAPEVQVLLLRVLETQEIQPVGSAESQKIDVRVIAATDLDIENKVEEGRFRAPLFHRLAGYEIRVPPLRERRADFGQLFYHFLRLELEALDASYLLDDAKSHKRPWLPASIVARLARYDWPGNVRQLRNVVRRLVVGGVDAPVVQIGPQLEDLLAESAAPPATLDDTVIGRSAKVPEPPETARRKYRKPSEVGEEELVAALRASRWHLKPAAAALGISRASLYVLIEKSPEVRKAVELSREEIERASTQYQGDIDTMACELEVSQQGLKRRMKTLGLR